MWCIGQLNADFIAQMEEVLELFQPANPKEPVINFDEAMKQMVSCIQESLFQANLRQPERSIMNTQGSGSEYLPMYDRHNGWRHAKATKPKVRRLCLVHERVS